MKLKRLEINGFKSFPGKTNIDFCDGITSVVGPNGSGKSNIMEAIRWVMGEQRTRSLRCKKMEDVIFNGSETLKPVGMAEVRLTLGNDGKSFPPPMSDYDEIMVARRLFREGNSQYELNGVPCRLTDIIEFFMDTGIGRNSYAIIEQGRVEQIIAAKPEERRVFLEEAASINRYKARRESTIKKLEQTNQNLQRIKDVVSEVKKQSQALKKQALKAQRFKELKSQLRELEINFEAFKCRNQSFELDQLKGNSEKFKDELAEKESNLGQVVAELESDRLKLSDTQRLFNELAEKIHSAEKDLNSAEHNLSQILNREKEMVGRGEKIKSDLVGLNQRMSSAQENLQKTQNKLLEFTSQMSHLNEKLTTSRSLIDSLGLQAKEQSTRLEGYKDQLFETLQSLSQQKNRFDHDLKRKTELQARVNKYEQDSKNQTEILAQKLEESETTREKKENIQQSLRSVESELHADQEQRSKLAAEIKTLTENARRLDKEFISIRTRIESLREQNKNYVSYGSGTQIVMKDFASLRDGTVFKPLAEVIECPPEYHTALSSVLNNQLGTVIVRDFTAALEVADKIKDLEISRVTLTSLDSFPRHNSSRLSSDHEPVTRLSDHVRGSEGFEVIVNDLLRDFHVVDDLTQARELSLNSNDEMNIVTLNGEILLGGRTVSVGSLDAPERDVLTKKSELENLITQENLLGENIQEMNSIINAAESAFQDLIAKIEKNGRLRSELSIEQVKLVKDLERLESEINRGRSGIRATDLDHRRISDDLNLLSKEDEDIKIRIRSLEEQRDALIKDKEVCEKYSKESKSFLDSETKKVNETRIKLAQIEERAKSARRDADSTKNFIRNCEHQISDLNRELEYMSRQSQYLSEDKTKYLTLKNEMFALHQKLSFDQSNLQESFNNLKTKVTTLTNQETSLSKLVESLRNEIHKNEIDCVRLTETLRNSIEKIMEKHNVDPCSIQCPNLQPTEVELSETRSAIESMGEVNLAAINESLHVKERLDFLMEQENDLKTAVKSLFSTIEKIDRTTSLRFQTTFQEVNTKFKEIFAVLFNGGEAWLELIGSEDSHDHGVNIMVKPPGKRLQNVDLLSGGEKALTAIAFIFAIFLYKPSSFCLLDEVDAPLDDSNVDRFNRMLSDLSRNTQFVVITHNKKSMEGSDSLFGVTSEEMGASTLVSVKLSE
jgi:chromosome segregation protein